MYSQLTTEYDCAQVIKIPFSDIEKIDFALCAQPTETPDKYYERQVNKPDFITNGGFFGMSNGATCFGFVDEFNKYVVDDFEGVGILGDKQLSLSRSADCFRDFVAGYPVLIKDGKAVKIDYAKEINYRARRTCIGWNDSYYFIVIAEKPGLLFFELQDLFYKIGATYAINLDGGGSSRLLINGKRASKQLYARPVDNVMCVYLKPQILYRVQVGAFANKSNAEGLLAKIKAEGFSDAYVRKIGLFYKVQVGAYSIKLNAERVKDRLKGLGYSAFIAKEEVKK